MTPQNIVIDFPKMVWTKVTGNGRAGRVKKEILPDNSVVRILEFSPKWNEITWCKKQHTGYVLSGKLQLAFRNKQMITIKKGQGFAIPKGHYHKASCKSKTTVFIVG